MDTQEKDDKPKPEVKDVPEPPKYFECHICGLKEKYEYKSTKIPHNKIIKLKEDSYFIKCPFTSSDLYKGQILIFGSDCFKCGKGVCQGPECSVYFDHRYCKNCALANTNRFPEKLRAKMTTLFSSKAL